MNGLRNVCLNKTKKEFKDSYKKIDEKAITCFD